MLRFINLKLIKIFTYYHYINALAFWVFEFTFVCLYMSGEYVFAITGSSMYTDRNKTNVNWHTFFFLLLGETKDIIFFHNFGGCSGTPLPQIKHWMFCQV